MNTGRVKACLGFDPISPKDPSYLQVKQLSIPQRRELQYMTGMQITSISGMEVDKMGVQRYFCICTYSNIELNGAYVC